MKRIAILVFFLTLFICNSCLAVDNYSSIMNKDVLGLKLGMEKYTALRYIRSLGYSFEDYFKSYDETAIFRKYFDPKDPNPSNVSEKLQVYFTYPIPATGCSCDTGGVVDCSKYFNTFKMGEFSGEYTEKTLPAYLNQRSNSYVKEIDYTYTFPHNINKSVVDQLKQKFIAKYGRYQEETSDLKDPSIFRYMLFFADKPFQPTVSSLENTFWADSFNPKTPIILVEIKPYQYRIDAKWLYPDYTTKNNLCGATQRQQKQLENTMDFKVKY